MRGRRSAPLAAAIDAPGTLVQSWAATKGIGLQLVLTAILTVGPFYLLVFLLPALLASSGVVAAAPLSSLLLQVMLGSLTSAAGFALVAIVHSSAERRVGKVWVSRCRSR